MNKSIILVALAVTLVSGKVLWSETELRSSDGAIDCKKDYSLALVKKASTNNEDKVKLYFTCAQMDICDQKMICASNQDGQCQKTVPDKLKFLSYVEDTNDGSIGKRCCVLDEKKHKELKKTFCFGMNVPVTSITNVNSERKVFEMDPDAITLTTGDEKAYSFIKEKVNKMHLMLVNDVKRDETTYKFTVCSWTCVGEEDEDHDEHLFKEGDGVKTEGVVKKDEL